MSKCMNNCFPPGQVSQAEQTTHQFYILSPVIPSKGLPYTLSLFTFSTTLWTEMVFAPFYEFGNGSPEWYGALSKNLTVDLAEFEHS